CGDRAAAERGRARRRGRRARLQPHLPRRRAAAVGPAAVRAADGARRLRGGRLAPAAIAGALACVAAHLVFALATLAASGALPDWGEYLVYLREFLFGTVG